MIELQIALKNLLLPPGLLLLMALWGLMFQRRLLGRLVMIVALGLLWVLSLPYFGDRLLNAQETIAPISIEQARAFRPQAIVVLGGGVYRGALEYGGDTVSESLLLRVRYAAWLAKRLALPVIPSGGGVTGARPEAQMVAEILREEYEVEVTLTEERSRTTWENAHFTAEILRQEGIERVLLVTHAWHMPRASEVFRQAGVALLAAPTGFNWPEQPTRLAQWIPDAEALHHSSRALHEMLGRSWYALRAWSGY